MRLRPVNLPAPPEVEIPIAEVMKQGARVGDLGRHLSLDGIYGYVVGLEKDPKGTSIELTNGDGILIFVPYMTYRDLQK